jgi:ABC-type branched-subunit amino acid transport system substrate-binding protein
VADQFTKLGGQITSLTALSAEQSSFQDAIRETASQLPDAVVLVAYPAIAGTTVIQEWTASATPTRWYLSPSLKTDVFVENTGPGVLDGSVGISAAVATDSDLFKQTFAERWPGDYPLTEAFFYYDALSLVSLALAEAAQHGAAPDGDGVRDHIRSVSASPAGDDIAWFDLGHGLDELRRGLPINYRGASGAADLDADGEVGTGLVRIWTVSGDHVVDGDLLLAAPL